MVLSKYIERIQQKIRKKKFLKEIENSNKQGKMTNWLALKFIKMADEIGNSDKFVNYPLLDDAKAHAVMQLTNSWAKFNTELSTEAETYFTTVIHCAFAYHLNQEKKEQDIKENLEIELDDGNST